MEVVKTQISVVDFDKLLKRKRLNLKQLLQMMKEDGVKISYSHLVQCHGGFKRMDSNTWAIVKRYL